MKKLILLLTFIGMISAQVDYLGRNTKIGLEGSSSLNNWARDAFFVGLGGGLSWNTSTNMWNRYSGPTNDFKGMLFGNGGLYFFNEPSSLSNLNLSHNQLLSLTKFTILNSGNIGIGTSNPLSTLDVRGRAAFGTDAMSVIDWTYEANWGGNSYNWAGYIGFNAYRANDTEKDWYLGMNDYTSNAVIEGSNNGFRFMYSKVSGNNGTQSKKLNQLMRLTQDGQLLIGNSTVNGDYKLFVKGGIRTEKIKVDIASVNGWADFVFKSTYRLRPLSEVELFIAENNHLPDVPSAEKVVEEGVDLAEMNKILLQKIEELTLYTIQQQKALEAQQKELEELKNKIGG